MKKELLVSAFDSSQIWFSFPNLVVAYDDDDVVDWLLTIVKDDLNVERQ